MQKFSISISSVFALFVACSTLAEEVKLNPLGAEIAGNSDGSIPEWNPADNTGNAYTRILVNDADKSDPVLVITAKNHKKYLEKLTPGQIALLTKYPDTFRINIYKTVRDYSAPQWVYEETEKNRQCKGAVLFGGIPYPVPQNGYEAILNHRYRWQGITSTHTFRSYIVRPDGEYDGMEVLEENHFPYYDTSQSASTTDLKWVKLMPMSPPNRKGEILIMHDHMEGNVPAMDAWQYLPGTRRVRTAPNLSYDFPNPMLQGQLGAMDDYDVFDGAVDLYTWNLKGKQEIYIPYHNNKINDVQQLHKKMFPANHIHPDFVRYELHRVWVVEGILKAGKTSKAKRRVMYLDEDSWSAVLADKYDDTGDLYQVNMGLYRQTHKSPAMFAPVNVYYSLQTGEYQITKLTADYRISNNLPQASYFSTAHVRKLGKNGGSHGAGYATQSQRTTGLGFDSGVVGGMVPPAYQTRGEKYADIESNGIKKTSESPVSTFSIDVDTGSYSNVRDLLSSNITPPEDAVRVEEFINYFKYDYPKPADKNVPFVVKTELGPSPWNKDTLLLQIGLQAYEVNAADLPPMNLVFLIDTSGSMAHPNKIDLLKSAFSILVSRLRSQDKISIVTYASDTGIKLKPTAGNRQQEILDVIESLKAGGSTSGYAGLEEAYKVAEDAYIKGGVNRIIIATDGDFNVGPTKTFDISAFIESKRDTHVSITTLGFGRGNYRDELMEKIANVGNGNAFYIDSLSEANKVFGQGLTGTLVTVAKDVKAQIEFNLKHVSEYRLIGYENRLLKREDFDNDKVDAGDMGSDHSVTVLYEIALMDSDGEKVAPLRYGELVKADEKHLDELAYLKIRYKKPDGDSSQLLEKPILFSEKAASLDKTSTDFRFASAVAGFAQLLRGGEHMFEYEYKQVLEQANGALGSDDLGYRKGFTDMLAGWLENKDRVEKVQQTSNEVYRKEQPRSRAGCKQ